MTSINLEKNELVQSSQNSDIFIFQPIKEEQNRVATCPTGLITNSHKSERECIFWHHTWNVTTNLNTLQSLQKPPRIVNTYKYKWTKQTNANEKWNTKQFIKSRVIILASRNVYKCPLQGFQALDTPMASQRTGEDSVRWGVHMDTRTWSWDPWVEVINEKVI